MEIGQILLAGDSHGNLWYIKQLFLHAKAMNCDAIVQLGDFGYWEHTLDGVEFLDAVSQFSIEHDIPFYWLDGNHENHALLRSKYNVEPFKLATIRENVFYMPRGYRWEWSGWKFLALGGAFSIDRNSRRVGSSFWFEEEIDGDDVANAIGDKSKVDIMLTHDSPAGVDFQLLMGTSRMHYRPIREAEKNRTRIREVVNQVQPFFLFHGHYHVYYKQKIYIPGGKLEVVGLGCDTNPLKDSILYLDLRVPPPER